MSVPMTEPTTPSPSRELIEKWRAEAERHRKHGDCYRVGQGWGLDQCADQLLAALAGETPPLPSLDLSREAMTSLAACLVDLGLTKDATIASVQRRLNVDAPNAMRLLAVREAVASLAIAGETPAAQAPETRFAWLLEKAIEGQPAYWDGGHAESSTRDANRAIQFATRDSAFWVAHPGLLQWGWQIVEHGFMERISSPLPAREALAQAHEHQFADYSVCWVCGQTEAAISGCHHCHDSDSVKAGRCWWCLKAALSSPSPSGTEQNNSTKNTKNI